MKRLISILILFVCFSNNAQHSDTQAAIYNIASGAVIGGIGAVINKEKDESFFKAFKNGSFQGALGGYLVFESKRLIRDFSLKNNYSSVWPSRIINSAGNSIILNGASNNEFGQKWYLNFGFNHMEYDFTENRKFKYRIMPVALLGTIRGFTMGKFDIETTVKTGVFTFRGKERHGNFDGLTMINSIFYWDQLNSKQLYQIIAHEIIHTYQYDGLMGTNAFYDKIESKFTTNSFFNKYDSLFYTDFNSIPLLLMHEYDAHYVPYEKRLVEREAYYFDGSNL